MLRKGAGHSAVQRMREGSILEGDQEGKFDRSYLNWALARWGVTWIISDTSCFLSMWCIDHRPGVSGEAGKWKLRLLVGRLQSTWSQGRGRGLWWLRLVAQIASKKRGPRHCLPAGLGCTGIWASCRSGLSACEPFLCLFVSCPSHCPYSWFLLLFRVLSLPFM